MGQKVNPVGLRLGIIKGWDSAWFDSKSYAGKIVEDNKIRKYIKARIPKGGISKIVIERTLKRITLTIHGEQQQKLDPLHPPRRHCNMKD